jgi:hypothetical protein
VQAQQRRHRHERQRFKETVNVLLGRAHLTAAINRGPDLRARKPGRVVITDFKPIWFTRGGYLYESAITQTQRSCFRSSSKERRFPNITACRTGPQRFI